MRYALGLLLVVVIAFGSAIAAEQKRVALVIGNANYGDFGQLKNPVNDAIDISSKLDSLGFEVITLIDANKRKMKQGIRNFTRKLGSNSVALFYFAGHGVEIKGRNYLVPVNADIQSEADVEFEAVDAGRVLAHMGDSDSMLKMAILDACRNNPFNSSFRSASRGLVRMNVPTGTLLMYATRPGDVAADGEGRNGVFTQHFLASLDEPGLEAYGVFKRTATQVFEATNKQQTPYFEGFVTGDFVFNRAAKNESKAARQTTASNSPPGTRQLPNNLQQKAELLYWESVAREDSTDLYRNYLDKYPNGLFADIAKSKLPDAEEKMAKIDPPNPANPDENADIASSFTFLEDIALDQQNSFKAKYGKTYDSRDWVCRGFSDQPSIRRGDTFTILEREESAYFGTALTEVLITFETSGSIRKIECAFHFNPSDEYYLTEKDLVEVLGPLVKKGNE